jgi:hypothetical protein
MGPIRCPLIYPNDQDGYSTLARVYLCLDRLPEVDEVLRQAQAHNVEGENLRLYRYQLTFLQNDTDEMGRLSASSASKAGTESVDTWEAWE